MRTLLMLCLIALITGCSNDDEPKIMSALNVNELVGFVGEPSEHVKSNLKNATLENESSSLGKVTLRYGLLTEESNYSITFKSDADGIINKIDVYGSLDGGYDKGVEIYKANMDKIDSTINHETYRSQYSSASAGLIDFSDRSEFWDYVAKNGVGTSIYEIWWIENTAKVKFTIECEYIRGNNAISIEIEKKSWE